MSSEETESEIAVEHTRHDMKQRNKAAMWFAFGAALIFVGVGSFVGGVAVGRMTNGFIGRDTEPRVNSSTRGFGGFGKRAMGGLGTVTAVSPTSITVNDTRLNAARTYAIDSTTVVTDNGASSTVGAIKDGDTVRVRGTAQTSSSTTTWIASSIDINPTTTGANGTSSTSTGGSVY